jgi:hypothetical protein
MMFKKDYRNWIEFRKLSPSPVEYDYHAGENEDDGLDYQGRMEWAYDCALSVLKQAQSNGKKYVMFIHGWSTSRIGKTTIRSQIRKCMRSKDATPFLIRKECIQHHTVFIASIRPSKSSQAGTDADSQA